MIRVSQRVLAKLRQLKDVEEKAGFLDSELETVNCYCMLTLEGDIDHCIESSVKSIKQVIPVLNFYLSSTIHRPHWAKVRIVDFVMYTRDNWSMIGYSTSRDPNNSLDVHSGKRGLIKWGKKLICESSGKKISSRIRRAISWYGRAVDSESPEESFTCLSIALESLLISRGEDNNQTTSGSISQKLRERVAFLLEKTPQERIQVAKLVGGLYWFTKWCCP